MASSKLMMTPLDSSLCPICLEVPLEEVFQCKYGHVVCSICVTKLKNCGQCRIPLGKRPMRNRAFETLLDDAEFNCSNLNCTEILKRKDLQRHRQICRHRQVNACSKLGFKCEYNAEKAADFCKHLKDVHHAGGVDRRSVLWQKFLGTYVGRGELQNWTDLITHDGERFLINVQLSFKPPVSKGAFSFTVLYLGDVVSKALDYRATVNVSVIYKLKKTRVSSWSGLPIHFKFLDRKSDVCPCVSLPVSFFQRAVESQMDLKQLAKNKTEFDVVLKIRMSKSIPSTPIRQPAKRIKLEPVASTSGSPVELKQVSESDSSDIKVNPN